HRYGGAVAFGIPGALMFVATVIFWLGRKRYVLVPPTPPDPDSFLRVSWTALNAGFGGQVLGLLGIVVALASMSAVLFIPSVGFTISFCSAMVALIALGGAGVWLQLDRVRGSHTAEAVEGVRAVLRVLLLFFLVTPFWSLFDQK